jgi:hypothetical protein
VSADDLLRRCPLLPLLLAASCTFGGVEPIPLAGPPPRAVLVWPRVGEVFAAYERELLSGLDLALLRRGYQVTSTAVARQLLAERGMLTMPPPAPQRVGSELAVDAVLLLDVREFAPVGDRLENASWDLRWELRSAQNDGVSWQFVHRGSWNRSTIVDEDPLRPIDTEPGLVPPATQVSPSFRDAADLAAWLNRLAMDHLPRAEP